MQSRLSGVPAPRDFGAPFPNDAPRRRVALTLDLVAGPVAFFALLSGTIALVSAVHAVDGWTNAILGASPSTLWLALLIVLARRGQTLGQALVGLRWVTPAGQPARWRPAGELQFWSAALPTVLMGGPVVFFVAWSLAQAVAWRIAHINLVLPSAYANGILPGAVLGLATALVIMPRARRRPARLAAVPS